MGHRYRRLGMHELEQHMLQIHVTVVTYLSVLEAMPSWYNSAKK